MTMIATMRDWFRERSPREQRMLVMMALIALPILLWLLLVRPMVEAREAAIARHLEAVDRNGRVRALAEAAKTSPALPAASISVEDMAAFVAASAAEQGITLEDSQSAGPGAMQIATASVSALAVQRWLSAMEEAGVRLADIRVVPDAAGSGTVRLTARIEGGS